MIFFLTQNHHFSWSVNILVLYFLFFIFDYFLHRFIYMHTDTKYFLSHIQQYPIHHHKINFTKTATIIQYALASAMHHYIVHVSQVTSTKNYKKNITSYVYFSTLLFICTKRKKKHLYSLLVFFLYFFITIFNFSLVQQPIQKY